MNFGSSDDDSSHLGWKRSHPETDEEDVSSVASWSDSDVEEPQAVWELTHRNHHVMPRRRRHRRGTGRARADNFMATIRLMSEVESLRRQRDELMSLHYARVLNTGRCDALVNTTIEYFDTFRDGFRGPRLPEMIRFFNTRLDHELFVYGAGNLGLDTWIEQWRRYTRIFPSLSMRLRSMDVVNLADTSNLLNQVPDDPTIATYIIHTTGILDGIITRQAVCTVFPHLRTREDLIQKLVGRSLNLPIDLRFYFNNTGRVIRYDFDGDYFQAFSRFEDIDLIELTQIMEHVAIGENTTVPAPVELGEDDGSL